MEYIKQNERAEDINVSYEEALQLAPPQLRKKIQHSVELIRKAEKIALMYDPKNGFYNTFSGGKDSQALFHIVKISILLNLIHRFNAFSIKISAINFVDIDIFCFIVYAFWNERILFKYDK